MLELRFCTIISNDGITIFHRTFVEDELDEYLFSGFSSAMIAFSKELGDELTRIRMDKQTIFFQEATEEGYLIMSITTGYDMKEVNEKLRSLHQKDSLDLLLQGSRLGMVQNENENFERDLFDIFEINGVPSKRVEGIHLDLDEEYAPTTIAEGVPMIKKKKKTLEEQLQEEAKSMFEEDDELASVLEALEDWD
ncbi:MAG: hypothetical protein ACXAE3_08905 [Candidatus Kariarchaeaceae archaeon]|jgi:hypothetical protein